MQGDRIFTDFFLAIKPGQGKLSPRAYHWMAGYILDVIVPDTKSKKGRLSLN